MRAGVFAKCAQNAQAVVLAFFGMELHPKDIASLDCRGDFCSILTARRDVFFLCGEVVAVIEIET